MSGADTTAATAPAGGPGTRLRRWGRSLGGRLALLVALAVALAVTAVSGAAYVVTARTLQGAVDEGLSVDAPRLAPADPEQLCRLVQADVAAPSPLGVVQVLRPDGTTCATSAETVVPASEDELRLVAGGGGGTVLRDAVTADGVRVRVATSALPGGYALQLVRDLTDVDATLRRLALVLGVVCLAGVVLAALAGRAVARSGLVPLDRLTGAVEELARTGDLGTRLPVQGSDEVARLSVAFNRLTEALRRSRQRQQQLVEDAGHELRTPLTSLRTNVELLGRSERTGRALPPGDRVALLDGMARQVVELSALVDSVVDLARPAGPTGPASGAAGAGRVSVDLADVVRAALDRVGPRGDRRYEVHLEPWPVHGAPDALERAVVNVLDNAVKFSPAGSTVGVRLVDGVLEVADRGTGIDPGDVDRVLDRFWRAPAARALPGSGLGLAIVSDVVTAHGGEVTVRPRDGGGTVVRLHVPATP